MIFFKTETHYEYMKKEGNIFIIDPLFYSAYHYVRKALINMSPEDERLETLELDETYYSTNVKFSPNQVLKNDSVNRISISDNKLEKVKLSPLFFDLIEILPYYINYKFYSDLNFFIEDMSVSIRGPVIYGNVSSDYSFPEDIERLTLNSYKRGGDTNPDKMNINYLYLYLALGEQHFPTVSKFKVNNVDDYLRKLSEAILTMREVVESTSPSQDVIIELLPNAGNEARASFFKLLRPIKKSYDEHMNKRSQRNYYSIFSYPTMVEKESSNEQESTRHNKYPVLKFDRLTLAEKMTKQIGEYETFDLSTLLDNKMKEIGYEARFITMKNESNVLYYSKNIRNDSFTRLVRSLSIKVIGDEVEVFQNN